MESVLMCETWMQQRIWKVSPNMWSMDAADKELLMTVNEKNVTRVFFEWCEGSVTSFFGCWKLLYSEMQMVSIFVVDIISTAKLLCHVVSCLTYLSKPFESALLKLQSVQSTCDHISSLTILWHNLLTCVDHWQIWLRLAVHQCGVAGPGLYIYGAYPCVVFAFMTCLGFWITVLWRNNYEKVLRLQGSKMRLNTVAIISDLKEFITWFVAHAVCMIHLYQSQVCTNKLSPSWDVDASSNAVNYSFRWIRSLLWVTECAL